MELLMEITDLINEKEFNQVINKVNTFLDENPEYRTIDYYHFANPIEETLYDVYIGEVNSLNKLGLGEALDEIYMIYAASLKGIGKLDEAEKYIKIAKQINPVSARIIMEECEIYQAKHEEEKLKDLSLDIMKYSYDVNLLISAYFKLADYYYHTGEDMEIYDSLFNFYITIRTGDEMGDVKEAIKHLNENNIQIGFNNEILSILTYLYDVYSKNGMVNAAQYFKNILEQCISFQRYLASLK